MHPAVHDYDSTKFDFVSILSGIYDVDDLAKLRADVPIDVLTVETDQATDFHAKFYDAFEPSIRTLYREFIASIVPDVLKTDEFCFQRVPTFRIHLPGNVAVGEFHTDGDYNHGDGEINFWVPFTPAWGSNSVWIEDELGSAKYEPVTLNPGQALVFDAVNWSHGNVVNETGHTRVSFDFRCIPLKNYTASTLKSVDAGLGLWIGEYFDVL
ncbi:hypothetical protein ACOZ38_10920 [Sphaerisporangium viridialbum]|uniref:hypothetical protein n=1 Tax=Sphaerisporangium viridialbum TaxID=46189 RepID=UPI003C715C00